MKSKNSGATSNTITTAGSNTTENTTASNSNGSPLMKSKSLKIPIFNFKELSLSLILDPISNKIVLFKTSLIMKGLK
jgi:hypothetical protein